MKRTSALSRRTYLSALGILSVAGGAALSGGMIVFWFVKLPGWAAVLIGTGVGLAAGLLVLRPFADHATESYSAQIGLLRDAAVGLADGSARIHAGEHAPGELGELGAAINRLSRRLSQNLYQLILERNRLKYVLDNLSEGIIAVDVEGKITHRNPAVDALMTADDHVSDLRLQRMDNGRVWADLKRAIESGESTERTISFRKDRIIRLSVSPLIDEIGKTAGAVCMFADITEQERLETTRREYVANVSHEMRTPLTAMRALVEPLKEGLVKDEPSRMRYYDIILREVARLSRLISDLMELSRLQSGTLAIEKRSMPLDDLLYDVCDRYSAIAEDHGLFFTVEGDLSALPKVWSNADRVEQMMVILLDNAIKYTEQGGLTVSAVSDEKAVRISVRDTGVGISAEDLPHVFDRFYKVDKAHSGKGSGLGLSIAKELWTWMGEELTVESVKGKGTCFTFTVARSGPEKEQE